MDRATSLADVRDFARSHNIIQGRVTALDTGFYEGVPFVVAEIQGAFDGSRFLLLPGGTITVEGSCVCTGDASMGQLPVVGDEVLAVVGVPIDDRGAVYRLPGERLFVQHADSLYPSPILAHDLARSAITTLAQLRRALGVPPVGHTKPTGGEK